MNLILDIDRLKIFEEKYKKILEETKNIRNIAKFYKKTKSRIKKINKKGIVIDRKFIDMLNTECYELNEFIDEYHDVMDKYYSGEYYDELLDVLNEIQTRCFIIKSILNNIENYD